MKFYLVRLSDKTRRDKRLEYILKHALKDDLKVCNIYGADEFISAAESGQLQKSRILIAAEIDESGICMDVMKVLSYLNTHNEALKGSYCSVIVDGCGDLHTKDTGRRIVFSANCAGAAFPGKPLVEATGSLANFAVISKVWAVERKEAYLKSVKNLIDKLMAFRYDKDSFEHEKPQILVLHAGNRKTSNSYTLWKEVAKVIGDKADIEDISIRNGQVQDCRGCKYERCLHYGEQASCFYGGVMVEKVYPAILKADTLVVICPNYNDAISANIMALINRLTAIFITHDFSRKRIFSIVVSGYSGSDIVAQQIIGAINMNKNFILPPYFVLMATANDPGTVMDVPGIEKEIAEFAEKIV